MYFYFIGGKRIGPIDELAIVHLIRNGTISADTAVLRDSWKSPRPASSAFKEHFKLAVINPITTDKPDNYAAYLDGYANGVRQSAGKEPSAKIAATPYPGCIILLVALFTFVSLGLFWSGNVAAGICVLLIITAFGVGAAFVIVFTQEERHNVQELAKQNEATQNGLHQHRLDLDQRQIKLENERINLEKIRSHLQRPEETIIKQRADALAVRYLEENVEWISSRLTSANYPQMKTRLEATINSCRAIGYSFTSEDVARLGEKLHERYRTVLRHEAEKAKQASIREQIQEGET
ncbi:MAG: hypothetical protein ACRC46_11995 [Thermoguttaceae bacterium]